MYTGEKKWISKLGGSGVDQNVKYIPLDVTKLVIAIMLCSGHFYQRFSSASNSFFLLIIGSDNKKKCIYNLGRYSQLIVFYSEKKKNFCVNKICTSNFLFTTHETGVMMNLLVSTTRNFGEFLS